MCVSTYVCIMFVCVYVCVYLCMYVCVYVCVYFLLFSEYAADISFTQLPSSPFVTGARLVFCKV